MPAHAHLGPATRLQCHDANGHLVSTQPAQPEYECVTTRSSRSTGPSNSIPPSNDRHSGQEVYDRALEVTQTPYDIRIQDHCPFPKGHSFVPENQVNYNHFAYSNGHYDHYPQDQPPPSPTAPSRNTLSDILHQHSPQSRPRQASDRFGQLIEPEHSNEGSSIPCSPNTFFASHKAHRAFKGAVEKFHHEKTDYASGSCTTHEPSEWSRWNLSPDEASVSAINPQLINRQSSASQPPYNHRQSLTEAQEMPAPYITRSQVHRLAGVIQESALDQSGSSTFHHSTQSTSRASTQSKTRLNQTSYQHNHQESSHSFPVQASTVSEKPNSTNSATYCNAMSSGNVRNNDGLPSNSHHLLNSPENKSFRVPSCSSHNASSELQDAKGGPRRGSSADLQQASLPSMFSQEVASSGPAIRRPVATPTKQKTHFNHHRDFGGDETADSSDNAASLLMALSRSEERTHGMALRRGRGSIAPRIETAQADSSKVSCDRPAGPPTPSGRRYRTRSQIHDEAQHAVQERYDLAPIQAPLQTALDVYSTRARCGQTPQAHHQQLGHGLPLIVTTGRAPHLSVSGSTAASTCTNASAMNGEVRGIVHPGSHEAHMLHSSIHSRNRARVSDSSNTPSMATVRSMTVAGMTDDDARSCFSISTQATSLASPAAYHTRRTFPSEVPIDPHFPRLYRAFYVSSAFGERDPVRVQAEANGIHIPNAPVSGIYNSPAHGPLDLYTPRFVKGVGSEKVGLCCICAEPRARGGEDLALWLKMKVSSYSYHLGFFHGINNADGLPFSPPVEIRRMKRGQVAANEKLELKEGRCHQCNKWIAMEGVKLQEVKVPELFWWKHAKSCHKSRIAGESHVHVEDDLYDLVMGHQNRSHPPHSSSSTSSILPKHHPSPAPHSAGSNRVHPSVAAQRASAGRVYKRKASNSSLNGAATSAVKTENFSPYSMGFTHSASSSLSMLRRPPQSPTPTGPYHQHHEQLPQLQDHGRNSNTMSLPPRKTRRSTAWKGASEHGQS